MIKPVVSAILALTLLFAVFPFRAAALEMPSSVGELASWYGIAAPAYAVADVASGQLIMAKNADQPWTAASLTKLVTAMVALDSSPKMSKAVAITQQDQADGGCAVGGACIRARPGVRFSVEGLFYASLLPSANNAASALARSTGWTREEFVKRMNDKAVSLGALSTKFVEPTGMNPANVTTAGDYSKIVSAAFSSDYLRQVASRTQFFLRSTNNSRFNQTVKNTNRLLGQQGLEILAGKTGFLEESRYNFASLLNYAGGRRLAVVVLGEERLEKAFSETKVLAQLAELGWNLSPLFVPPAATQAATH